MISPWIALAISSDKSVLPEAVGPRMTIRGLS